MRKDYISVMQSQKAVGLSDYLTSKQILPFSFEERI